MSDVYPLTLYFDGSCPLCRAEMHNLELRDAGQKLRFVDISVSADYPPGTDFEALMTLIHAQCADGSVLRGVEVFRLAYGAVGIPWVARLTRLPGLKGLSEALYPWIARNRYRLPRVFVWWFDTALRRAAQAAAGQVHCGAEYRVGDRAQS